MKFLNPVIALFVCAASTATCLAQALPQITLQPVLTKLQTERPVWMSEAPDGSGRLFVVYQTGTILVVKKGSDGGEPGAATVIAQPGWVSVWVTPLEVTVSDLP